MHDCTIFFNIFKVVPLQKRLYKKEDILYTASIVTIGIFSHGAALRAPMFQIFLTKIKGCKGKFVHFVCIINTIPLK